MRDFLAGIMVACFAIPIAVLEFWLRVLRHWAVLPALALSLLLGAILGTLLSGLTFALLRWMVRRNPEEVASFERGITLFEDFLIPLVIVVVLINILIPVFDHARQKALRHKRVQHSVTTVTVRLSG